VKNALDEDLKYGSKHLKGHESVDKLIDWECKLNEDGALAMDDQGDIAGPRRKTQSQELQDAAHGGFGDESDHDGPGPSGEPVTSDDNEPGPERRRLATVELAPSDKALHRRCLSNRPRSHIVVLERLMKEINRPN